MILDRLTHTDLPNFNPAKDPYTVLAMAVIRQAVDDWRALIKYEKWKKEKEAAGTYKKEDDKSPVPKYCNWVEMELFFRRDCDDYIPEDSSLTGEAILDKLQEERRRALAL